MKPEVCVECAFHRVIKDPDPFDSFNYDDVAIVCTQLVNTKKDCQSKYRADHSDFAVVSCSLRPYETDKIKPLKQCPFNI